jgi:hypothetical protein
MPFQKLQFKPGVNRDQTNYTNEGGWYECDKIRFRSGMPEKIGGWLKTTPRTILGTCRQMFGWITSYADNFLALGTNKKAYIEVGGYFYDITPVRATTAAGDVTFTATNGSSTITVLDTAFGSTAGDYVTFSGAVSLGGNITAAVLNQNYEIATAINNDAYTIVAKNPTTGAAVLANASDSGTGGNATVGAYQIAVGAPGGTYGYGFGTGTWNDNYGWGLASPDPVFIEQTDWWFDQFDNDLVMNIRNGAIYYWQRGSLSTPETALATPATLLSGLTLNGVAPQSVPNQAMQTLVSQNDKHLLAFGCQPYAGGPTDFDPLLIRWASQDQPNIWNPLTTNTAGFLRVARGSQIVRAIPTKQEILVFTEATLNSLQFLGTNDVFSLQEIGDNLSVMGPRAVIVVNNMTFWMGHDKFYVYTGRVETLPCTLRNHVFNDINFDQSAQVIAGTNEGWNEVWWMYPSANSNYNNKYVIYNHLERIWYYGNIERTAWIDNPLREYPQAIYTDNTNQIGYLLDHERGTNDDTLPMTAYIQSSDFDLMEGDQFVLTRRMIPDINFSGSTATSPEASFIIRPRNFPGSAFYSNASNTQRVIETTVDQFTEQVFVRARARQLALKVQSTGLNTQWQLGSPRLDMRPDGKR